MGSQPYRMIRATSHFQPTAKTDCQFIIGKIKLSWNNQLVFFFNKSDYVISQATLESQVAKRINCERIKPIYRQVYIQFLPPLEEYLETANRDSFWEERWELQFFFFLKDAIAIMQEHYVFSMGNGCGNLMCFPLFYRTIPVTRTDHIFPYFLLFKMLAQKMS